MSAGSPIRIQKSQSPENIEVPSEETSDNKTSNVQVIPPSFNNPIPKMIFWGETGIWQRFVELNLTLRT